MVCNWDITYFSAYKCKRSSWIEASDGYGRISYFLLPRIPALGRQGEDRSVEGKPDRGKDKAAELQGLRPKKSLSRNLPVTPQLPWEEIRQVANRKKEKGECLDPRILTWGDFYPKQSARQPAFTFTLWIPQKILISTVYGVQYTRTCTGFITHLKPFS